MGSLIIFIYMADNLEKRPSLIKTLEDKYKTEYVGGAYDAKLPTPDIFGLQEKYWTTAGFVSANLEQLGTGGTKKIEDSLYRQGGFTNKKYKEN